MKRGPSKAPGRRVETKPLVCSDVEGRIHIHSKTGAPYLRTGDGCRLPQEFPRRFAEHPLTGRWIDRVGRYNFFVNQAGPYLEILWTLCVNGATPRVKKNTDGTWDDPRPTELAFRLSGVLGTGGFDLYDAARTVVGKLRVVTPKKLQLVLAVEAVEPRLREFHESTMKRLHTRPSLFERYLGDPSIPPQLRTAHWFPLTPQQVALTSRLILDTRIPIETHQGRAELGLAGLILWFYIVADEFAGNRSQRDAYQTRAVAGIERLVKKVFNDAQILPAPGGGIHQDQQELHTINALRAIADEAIFVGEVSRSALYYLQDIVNRWPGESWHSVRRWLGIVPAGAAYFEATLDVFAVTASGLVLGGGIYDGVLNVRRKTAPTFDMFYPIQLTGGSAGKSLAPVSAGKIVTEGTAGPTSSWLPEHIPGNCIFSDLSGTASAGSSGGSVGGSLLSCFGADDSPAGWLSFVFPGFSEFLGLAGGLGLSWFTGSIGAGTTDYATALKALPSVPKDIDVVLMHATHYEHHYVVNNAWLTEEGQWAVGSIVATELAALSSKPSSVLIIGHADRNDEETKNEELSENRAANVERFMRSILPTPPLEADIVAMAASEFEHAGVEPDPEALDEEFRRVDIIINSAGVAKLRGPKENPRARTK